MTEEYLDERERDMLDYFRNNFTDPESRVITVTKIFTATAAQTTFILPDNYVKNVADTITIGSTTYRKGYFYTVTYGEGKDLSKLVLNSNAPALSGGELVTIVYSYGSSPIEREYSRSDVKLPRVIIMFITGSEEFAALGDDVSDGLTTENGSYVNVAYRIEIRDSYATRARRIASQIFNLARKLRHQNLFRTNISSATNIENFDYDIEKQAYVWQFTLEIQWEVMWV